jgi:hypothetical protein
MTKDPMLLATPDQQKQLFDAFCSVANGFSAEQVLGAAANLLVNAIRQAHPTQRGALARLDELSAKTKALLAEHYDAMGKRRNVFPFHQVIEVPHMNLRSKNGT